MSNKNKQNSNPIGGNTIMDNISESVLTALRSNVVEENVKKQEPEVEEKKEEVKPATTLEELAKELISNDAKILREIKDFDKQKEFVIGRVEEMKGTPKQKDKFLNGNGKWNKGVLGAQDFNSLVMTLSGYIW